VEEVFCGQPEIVFRAKWVTEFGSEVRAVGSSMELGSWNPMDGISLSTNQHSYPYWSTTVWVPPSATGWEYKFVVVKPDNSVEWEPGGNRRLAPPQSVQNVPSGGAHKNPVTCQASHSPLPVKSTPPWKSIACGNLQFSDEFPKHHRVDSSASTCFADDESSSSPEISPRPLIDHSLRFCSGAHQVEKAGGRCEDAHFQRERTLGVADGVGSMIQFAKYGADSAAYARDLMQLAAECEHVATLDVSALGRAVAALSSAESSATTYGASTALVLALEGNTVGVANLGDSGFLLLRRTPVGMAITERTKGQQHSWNCPYQLLRMPPALAARVPTRFKPDSALDCERLEVQVSAGDLLLLFTDGLSDNLHEHELLNIVNRLAGTALEPGCPQALARELTLAAHQRSIDPQAVVPFTLASRNIGQEILGGKPDDITVVAAWIV